MIALHNPEYEKRSALLKAIVGCLINYKIILIFLSLIFITSNLFAQSFVCLTKNFENKETFILLKKLIIILTTFKLLT